MIVAKQIPEFVIEGRRLGRHVTRDSRSRRHRYTAAHSTVDLRTIAHRRYGILDQGDVGSCTGNAVVGALNTFPVHIKKSHLLKEDKALEVYSLATKLDEWPGSYPPDDTGSSGLAACKAAKQLGLLKSYSWAFSIEDALSALQISPLITGVNWYEGFDKPTANGLVKVDGQIRGGHEFEIHGFIRRTNIDDCILLAVNSWGTGWGVKGRFSFTVKTWRRLLDEEGDCTILSS